MEELGNRVRSPVKIKKPLIASNMLSTNYRYQPNAMFEDIISKSSRRSILWECVVLKTCVQTSQEYWQKIFVQRLQRPGCLNTTKGQKTLAIMEANTRAPTRSPNPSWKNPEESYHCQRGTSAHANVPNQSNVATSEWLKSCEVFSCPTDSKFKFSGPVVALVPTARWLNEPLPSQKTPLSF